MMLQAPAALQGHATGGFKETRGARQLIRRCSGAQSGVMGKRCSFQRGSRHFVDKAQGGGHNEKASLKRKPRLAEGFTHRACARVAELADALASGASDRKVVEVRVLSRAPSKLSYVVSYFAGSAPWQ